MNKPKLFGALMLAVGLALIPSVASAAPKNPHHEEQDGCDHGNTGKPCKDDPQPDHGKDCVKHGKHGGINEDHCKGTTTTTTVPPTTTTTEPVVTTTTESPTTTTTQLVVVVPTTEIPVITTTTEAPAVTTTTQPRTAVDGVTLTNTPAALDQPDNLAVTGSPAEFLAGIGLILLLLGVGVKLLTNKTATN